MTGPDESFADRPDRRFRKTEEDSEGLTRVPRRWPAEPWAEFDEPAEFRPRRFRENDDANHLRLLSIFHFVAAGLIALFATLPVIHVVIGIAMVSGRLPPSGGSAPPPPGFGWMFVIFGSAFILFGWTLAICLFIAGRCLKRRRRYLFCLVVAGAACVFQPIGLLLGVFTFIVLLRPSVKSLFGQDAGPAVETRA